MMPYFIRKLLMMPLWPSKPIQAYTRSRNEVQKGSIIASSKPLRMEGWAREMA